MTATSSRSAPPRENRSQWFIASHWRFGKQKFSHRPAIPYPQSEAVPSRQGRNRFSGLSAEQQIVPERRSNRRNGVDRDFFGRKAYDTSLPKQSNALAAGHPGPWAFGGPRQPARRERLAQAQNNYHDGCMQTVFEAAGGNEGLRRLAGAWHKRVMADEVVAHAFSHGFHPQHHLRATRKTSQMPQTAKDVP